MRIEKSEALGRNIRRDRGEDLGESTWEAIAHAIRDGRTADALAYLEYGCSEARSLHDGMCSLADDAITHLARLAGDQEVCSMLRKRYEPVIRLWLATTPGLAESMERTAEFQRGHFGKISVKEEADRFVLTCDPCGSGGRLQRTKPVVRAQNAYDWTWSRTNVPYYCTHCAVMWEILPIEMRGYPIRINLAPEKSSDPCVHLYYKNPEQIPDQYYERVGRRRSPERTPGGSAGNSGTGRA